MNGSVAEALLGLGGNIGDVRATFDRTVTMLCAGGAVRLLARYPVSIPAALRSCRRLAYRLNKARRRVKGPSAGWPPRPRMAFSRHGEPRRSCNSRRFPLCHRSGLAETR